MNSNDNHPWELVKAESEGVEYQTRPKASKSAIWRAKTPGIWQFIDYEYRSVPEISELERLKGQLRIISDNQKLITDALLKHRLMEES